MNGLAWFLVGLAVIPVLVGLWAVGAWCMHRLRYWYTRPYQLEGRPLAVRRSLIIGLTLELLDARHVRGIRFPLNRIFVVRSNPKREYDFVGKEWVVIGGDYNNAEEVIGKALDELGYAESEA